MNTKEYKSRHLLLDSEVLSILDKYKSGISSPKLAEEFNISKNEMLRLLGQHGVTRSNLEAKNLRAAHVNHTFFDIIDTEAKAWCLGLMFSDGNVDKSKPTFNLAMYDEDVLHKFKSCLEWSGKVGSYVPILNKIAYRVLISSSQLKIALISHGCTPAKSHTLKFPFGVPADLQHHFIRGYFDGDGCISIGVKKTASFTCTEEFAKTLQYILQYNGVKCSIYRDKRVTNSCDVRVVQAQLPNLYRYMYNGSHPNIRMDRKYQKFTNYLQSQV